MSEWVCVQVHPRESDCEFSSITLSIVRNIWRISLPDGTTEPGEDKFFSALLVWIKDLSWDLRVTGSRSPALVNYVMCTTAARWNTRLSPVSTKTAEDFIWGIREWKVGERDGEMGREGGRCVCVCVCVCESVCAWYVKAVKRSNNILGCYQLPVFAAKHRHTKQDPLVIRKVVKL